MTKFIAFVLISVLILSFSGCKDTSNKENDISQNFADTTSETTKSLQLEVPVDWTDFIKIDGISYKGDWRETEVPSDRIGEKIGEVSCGVPTVYADENGNVADIPIADGTSFICRIGTELFSI